jgi:hypothetical protein
LRLVIVRQSDSVCLVHALGEIGLATACRSLSVAIRLLVLVGPEPPVQAGNAVLHIAVVKPRQKRTGVRVRVTTHQGPLTLVTDATWRLRLFGSARRLRLYGWLRVASNLVRGHLLSRRWRLFGSRGFARMRVARCQRTLPRRLR